MFKKIVLGTITAIVVLIVIVAIAGGSNKTSPTQSPALVTTTTKAVANQPARVAPQVFRGSGTENLGTINVTTASTLHWACSTCSVFGVDGSAGVNAIALSSQNRTSGVTAVEAGTYHSVSVIADEGIEGGKGWTITITAGQ